MVCREVGLLAHIVVGGVVECVFVVYDVCWIVAPAVVYDVLCCLPELVERLALRRQDW